MTRRKTACAPDRRTDITGGDDSGAWRQTRADHRRRGLDREAAAADGDDGAPCKSPRAVPLVGLHRGRAGDDRGSGSPQQRRVSPRKAAAAGRRQAVAEEPPLKWRGNMRRPRPE
ncbi:hypothetical protein ACP70R_041900 [Stipagrostis hirtigluma subsp. patula]